MQSFFKIIKSTKYNLAIFSILLIAIIFFVYLYKQLIDSENSKTRAFFEFEVIERIDYLKTNIERHIDILNATAAFFNASDDISRKDFKDFSTSVISRNESITGLSWNPYILNSQRDSYIDSAKNDGLNDFKILSLDENKKLIEDKNKKDYVSVFYIEPIEENKKALGFDISSNPSRKIAIEKACDSGEIVMTEIIKLVQKDKNSSGYLMLKAIYNKDSVLNTVEDRRKNFKGVVVGVFHLEKLISSSMETSSKHDFDLKVYDISNEHAKNLIHTYPDTQNFTNNSNSEFTYNFDILNRKWSISFSPSATFIKEHTTYNSEIFLFLALMITFMTSYLLYILSKDNQVLIKRYLNSKEYADLMRNKISEQTKKIREERDKFQTLIDYSSDGILILSPNDGKVLIHSKVMETMLGYSKDEFADLTVLDWDKDIKDIEEFKRITDYVRNSPITIERIHTRKDGTSYIALITAIKINIDNEELIYSSAKDITDLRKKEKLLIEQSKMVSMGEMIGNISHQWRQPLSAISIRATGVVLKKQHNILTDDEFYENMKAINSKVQFLSDTIETFRNFLSTDKDISTMIIQEEIEKSIYIINASLRNNFINLIKNLEVEPIKFRQAQDELEQVLINIINNSKDAIKENEIENPWIKISLYKESEKSIITIEDNGGGISDEVLPRIFEPYFTTKHKSQGTGLGLHICYIIITDSLKGNIFAKNNEFNGATITIELPKVKEDL